MIEKYGSGIDIVDVSQFKKIPYLTKSNFYKKIFTPSEIKYCLKYQDPYPHFAGKFAVKEAIKKSINETISMLNIKTHHSNSKLKISLVGNNEEKYKFLASLSHENNLAIAVVISEKI